ncbi:unnamed protein product [Meganyctiphanes norvegica]|uniref:PH domain-containing protein n=1 Tax=Meganyctiphanes norvegica TaxID=48144 RepID=A0AAV2QX04_MEGNR
MQLSSSGAFPITTLMPLPLPPKKTTTPVNTNIMDACTPTTSRKIKIKSIFTPPKKNDAKDKRIKRESGDGRTIPIKEEYLYKKSNKTLINKWKKKYVTLCDNGKLSYHSSLHDYMEDIHGKDISLKYTTVKIPEMHPRGRRNTASPDYLRRHINGINRANRSLSLTPNMGRASLGAPSTSLKVKEYFLFFFFQSVYNF